ncbi:MAG: hypothetical protein Q8Q14_16940 [Gemmatimonadales bacterium]|nr:hypothetical protein [Gemmatimonadales bacterium]
MESPVSPAAVILGASALLLAAQSPATLTGRIMHRGASDRALPRHWAYLHEFRGDSNRVLDSTRTDAAGRYRLTIARADTAARYVVATEYAEVDYFSQPLLVDRRRLEVDPIIVYDTTSRGAMRLRHRLLAVFRTEPASGRRAQAVVQEMVEVGNPGERTRIATDTTNPVWTIRLPRGFAEWSLAGGDVTADAVWLNGDTVKLFAPIWPDAPLRASYRYTLSPQEIRVPVDQRIEEVTVLVDDSAARVSGVPLQSLGMRELDGQRFAAYRAGPLEAGAEIRVTLPRGPLTPEDLLPYVIAGAALALAGGLWFALRRRPAR